MSLGWNEIKKRAVRFPKDWKDAFNEEAGSQTIQIHFLTFQIIVFNSVCNFIIKQFIKKSVFLNFDS